MCWKWIPPTENCDPLNPFGWKPLSIKQAQCISTSLIKLNVI